MDNNYLVRASRRPLIINSSSVTGFDYAQFNASDLTLTVYLLNNFPLSLLPGQIQLITTDGSGTTPWVIGNIDVSAGIITITLQPNSGQTNTASSANLSQQYLVTIDNAKVDPFFSQTIFTSDYNPIAATDCQTTTTSTVSDADIPIDYLSKDYRSFRQLMLNRLSVTMPQWVQDNPADIGMMLAELLAYAADQLSYYQDAAATEAYLGTARRRISVRRHARLLDYQIYEGCNARTWVQFMYNGPDSGPNGDGNKLSNGIQLLTQVSGVPMGKIDSSSPEYQQALSAQPIIFETQTSVCLYSEHNHIEFYTWGVNEYILDVGATSATLNSSKHDYSTTLKPGHILIFTQNRGPITGLTEDADPTCRWAVCLTQVTASEDPLYNIPVTEITWAQADALPFCFPIKCSAIHNQALASAHGNVALADQGQSVTATFVIPATLAADGNQISLSQPNLTFAVPLPAALTSAAQTLQQNPRLALPVIKLTDNDGTLWAPLADLLSCNRFSTNFVVEIENNREVFLRFGDNTYGEQPTANTAFTAAYRIGNGSQGNIGANSLYNWVIPDDSEQAAIMGDVTTVQNLLPASGGIDPEPLAQICMNAPQAFRQQARCVTPHDYINAALNYLGVAYAAASFRWTGSWYTLALAVVRTNQQPLDTDFIQGLSDNIISLQLLGYDIEIVGPTYVPLNIALVIQLATGYTASSVLRALQTSFGNTAQINAQQFLQLSNIGFGATIYLSTFIAQAMTVPGVAGVDLSSSQMRFQRYYQPPPQVLPTVIQLEPLEVAQIENNPNVLGFGQINFIIEGASS